MITKKVPYQSKEKYLFLDQKRQQLAAVRRKLISLGLDPNQHDVFTRPHYREKWLLQQAENQGLSKR